MFIILLLNKEQKFLLDLSHFFSFSWKDSKLLDAKNSRFLEFRRFFPRISDGIPEIGWNFC
jgi:hypothetical protein